MIVLQGKRAAVEKVCFVPGTRLLAAGDENGTVALWDLDAGKVVFTWPTGWCYTPALAASPDGQLAAAGGDRGKIVVWDVDL
jgi:WD40 repeat protein